MTSQKYQKKRKKQHVLGENGRSLGENGRSLGEEFIFLIKKVNISR